MALPAEQLRAELDEVRAEIDRAGAEVERLRGELVRLQGDEQLLARALRIAQAEEPGPTGRAGDAERQAVQASIATNALAVVRSAGGQSLAASDVHEFLVSRGAAGDASADDVREALRGWLEAGELGEKDGRYFELRLQSRALEYGEIVSQLQEGQTAGQTPAAPASGEPDA